MVHCPSCGAGLRFDIASQLMSCDYCRQSWRVEQVSDAASNDAKSENTYDSYAYICPSCGAEVDTTDKNDAVGFCPYCNGASMIFDKLRRDWVPDAVVPFKITKEQCKELYCAEVKKHIFVSKKYRDPQLVESFRGIYMPYVTFKAIIDGEISIRGEAPEKDVGNYYYQTDYYDVKTSGKFTVEGATERDASAAFDDHISDRIVPFAESDERPFHPGYLSGFYAESGNIDINEYGPVVWEEMLPVACDKISELPEIKEVVEKNKLSTGSANSTNHLDMKVTLSKRKLCPVWFMSYRNGKDITYAVVNGETGKVSADLPLSPLRILLAALICSAAIFALLFLLLSFLPTLPAASTLAVCTVLGLSGMFILQQSYINTIGSALNQEQFRKKIPVGFFVASALSVLGLILITTDGTYEQHRYLLGLVLGGIGLFLLVFRYLLKQSKDTGAIKKIELIGESMHSNGILIEAKKFGKLNALIRGVIFASMIINLAFIFDGTWGSAGYYTLAGFAAAELFGLALMHIFMQTKIAKRRPPQFNKKGAAYDEK